MLNLASWFPSCAFGLHKHPLVCIFSKNNVLNGWALSPWVLYHFQCSFPGIFTVSWVEEIIRLSKYLPHRKDLNSIPQTHIRRQAWCACGGQRKTSGAIHLLLETRSLTVTWNSTSRSGWLASEPQKAHLSLSPRSLDFKLLPSCLDFSYVFGGWNSGLCYKAKSLPAELSPQPTTPLDIVSI